MNQRLIELNKNSDLPLYVQIMQSIYTAIEAGQLTKGDKLPSINNIRDTFEISRDTVLKAYKDLSALGIIGSHPGKGYYIASLQIDSAMRIFLLFDDFTPYTEILYNSIKAALPDQVTLNVYFHHQDPKLYRKLISENLGRFTHYVISPILDEESQKYLEETFIDLNCYILDLGADTVGRIFPSVCQRFDVDIQHALSSAEDLLKKYNRFIMIMHEPKTCNQTVIREQMRLGFETFCKKMQMSTQIVNCLDEVLVMPGDCFFIHSDSDLIELLETVRKSPLKMGQDFGIISFNENPYKKVVTDGITTISSDFNGMGQTLVDLIINRKKDHVHNPAGLIRRASV